MFWSIIVIADEDAETVCQLAADEGDYCIGWELNWHYDADAGQCKAFYYGGCAGNGNRFKTEQACEKACVSVDQAVTPEPIDATEPAEPEETVEPEEPEVPEEREEPDKPEEPEEPEEPIEPTEPAEPDVAVDPTEGKANVLFLCQLKMR